jgi:hypothetical protein
MAPPERIVREFPVQGGWQLFRPEKKHEFRCVRCRGKKTSKLMAVRSGDWSRPLCNGCYGHLLSSPSEEVLCRPGLSDPGSTP